MKDRVTEIREALTGLGAEMGCSYPTRELCERYEKLQNALAKGVFEKTHA